MPRTSQDHYNNHFKPIVIALLRKRGKDFNQCEQCWSFIPDGKYLIHHTKYEGATLEDLQIVCAKCNMKPENKGLV